MAFNAELARGFVLDAPLGDASDPLLQEFASSLPMEAPAHLDESADADAWASDAASAAAAAAAAAAAEKRSRGPKTVLFDAQVSQAAFERAAAAAAAATAATAAAAAVRSLLADALVQSDDGAAGAAGDMLDADGAADPFAGVRRSLGRGVESFEAPAAQALPPAPTTPQQAQAQQVPTPPRSRTGSTVQFAPLPALPPDVRVTRFVVFFRLSQQYGLQQLEVPAPESCTVLDLLGYALQMYAQENTTRAIDVDPSVYVIRVAETDGEVDTDLPVPNRDAVAKAFGKWYLVTINPAAMLSKRRAQTIASPPMRRVSSSSMVSPTHRRTPSSASGSSHSSPAQPLRCTVFVPDCSVPSVTVAVEPSAAIADLLRKTLDSVPELKGSPMDDFTLRIAEDDGSPDTDFPVPSRQARVASSGRMFVIVRDGKARSMTRSSSAALPDVAPFERQPLSNSVRGLFFVKVQLPDNHTIVFDVSPDILVKDLLLDLAGRLSLDAKQYVLLGENGESVNRVSTVIGLSSHSFQLKPVSAEVSFRSAQLDDDLDGDEEAAPILMTEFIASQYKEYPVVKVNKYGVRQERVFGLDRDNIFNLLPQAASGFLTNKATRKPTRRIHDIIRLLPDTTNPRNFAIVFREGSNGSVKLAYECRTANAAKDVLNRLSFLLRLKRINTMMR